MAESDGMAGTARPPNLLISSSLVTGLIALALSGTGIYNSQDRFTGSDWREEKQDLLRIIEANRQAHNSHLSTHPDKGLDARLRELEVKIAIIEEDLKHR